MSKIETRECSQCGAPIDAISSICKFCGATVAVPPQYQEQQVPKYEQQVPRAPQAPRAPQYVPYQVPEYVTSKKSKITAGLLAIFLGGLGIHKFYLGRIGWGLVYILFCCTCIPSIIGLIEGIIYLATSDERFYYKYVKR